ncbi:MAG TPA: chitobiase/beta-hexosaminidase C-terminal domain-containing protein, partial [Anditalea sp.]|nr:chitobiase/beta-hexosaminidase C-terminal domain-containing protein [Anditalea sp.]
MKQSLPKLTIGFLMLLLATATAWAQSSPIFENVETFENLGLTGNTYRDGSFVGINGITWTYTHVTGEQSYPINAEGLLLRRSGENSNIKSDLISGGISSFQVLMRKAFTGAGDRQIGLFINDNLVAESITFGELSGGSEDIFTFEVDNINIPGDFTLEIRHLTGGTNNRQLVIDDISWNSFDGTATERVAAPQFSPEGGVFSTSQIISIQSETDGASIYYTIDGTNPTNESILYTDPIEIYSTVTLKALGIKEGFESSNVAEAEYVINTDNGEVAGLPYKQDFTSFISLTSPVEIFGESGEWTFSAGVLNYIGDFGSGTTGGFRGNGVLGYQHTGSTGILTSTLTLTNTTPDPIQDLKVSYLGKIARADQGRFPAFTVTVNGTVIPELGYSTEWGRDSLRSHVISGLNILPSQEVTISWSSDRGLTTTGSSRQIGLTDVSVATLISEAPITNIEDFDKLNLGTGYTNGSFVGNNEISWSYFASRNEGDFPIEGKGLMLRRASDNSRITSAPVPGGIGSFKVDMRKAFTGSVDRQIALFINGEEIARSEVFG